jgi:hypothetical protein
VRIPPVGVADTAQAVDSTLTSPQIIRAPSEALPAGARLGHFRIERKLGAGGMGEVYLAQDLALDRPVAIKVLPPGVGSASARERMIREARAQARVQHPNVAHMYFIGEEQGRLYFAMEHVTGKTLADRAAEGPLSMSESLEVIRGVALGLREAQRSGFTHRDVKPSNLMVDGHGMVKVLDFGLANSTPAQGGEGPVAQTTLAGTPLYMAPEQARGEPIDHRADIYALGATLYHLMSGRPPFQGDSMEQLLTQHATAPRPVLPSRLIRSTEITALDALIARMMAVRPQDRFATYDDLLRAIELISAEHTRPAGIWVRTMAAIIDLGLSAMMVAILSVLATGEDGGDSRILRFGCVFALVYRTIAVARWGTTAGKALFELEVVSVATARRPTWRQALRRDLVLLGALIVSAWGAHAAKLFRFAPGDLFGLLGAVSVLLICASLLHATLRVPGKRAAWDRASGTLVRYRTHRKAS